MNRLKQVFMDKRLRYGTFSTIMILVVIAVLVLVNLVASQLGVTADVSANKMFSLSSDSKKLLQDVNEPVRIYLFAKSGQEDMMTSHLLGQYHTANNFIDVQFKDPDLNPTFVKKYVTEDVGIAYNDIVVESDKRFKVIKSSDLTTTQTSPDTGQQVTTSIDVEPQVTNAVRYVTQEHTPIIYVVTGHNETPLEDGLTKQITMANYELKDLDIFNQDIPADASCILVTTPTRDWTVDEAGKLRTYLQNDGRAMFALSMTTVPYPNLQSVLQTYGVQLSDYIVFEGDANGIYKNTPNAILPSLSTQQITQKLASNKYRILLVNPLAVENLDIKKQSILIEPLLYTSKAAFGKSNLDSASINKEPGDADGPFNLAVAVTDTINTDKIHTSKLVVVGDNYLLNVGVDQEIGGGNFYFTVTALNWLEDQADSVFIPGKDPNYVEKLTMSDANAGTIGVISMGVIPLVILGAGVGIWLRRRHS